MDKKRKRELKKLGKRLVEERSAEIRKALQQSNPLDVTDEGWADNYREAVLLEKEIKSNNALVIPASAIDVHVVLLNDPGCNPGRSRIAVPGIYVQCDRCKDLIPTVAGLVLSCQCGALVHGPSPPGDDLTHLENRRFFKLLGKGKSGNPC